MITLLLLSSLTLHARRAVDPYTPLVPKLKVRSCQGSPPDCACVHAIHCPAQALFADHVLKHAKQSSGKGNATPVAR